MSDQLEPLLRIMLMNQIEIMAALEDLLHDEPLNEDDLSRRAQTRASLGDHIQRSIDQLNALNSTGSDQSQQ